MIHVLRHYFPLRKAFLVVSETVLLTLVVFAGMSLHLRGSALDDRVVLVLAYQGLSWGDAYNRCLVFSFAISVLGQVAIAFNELYDFRISSSFYDRAARFLGSAGTAVLLAVGAVVFVRLAGLQRHLQFPGVPTSQQVFLLTIWLITGFAILFFWRNLFHWLLRRWNFNERVLILGTGKGARALCTELVERLDTGLEVVGVVAAEPRRSAGHRAESSGGARAYSAAAPRGEGGAVLRLQRDDEETPALFRADDPAVLVRADGEEIERGEPLSEGGILDLARDLDVDTIAVALDDRRSRQPTEELLQCRLEGLIVEEGEVLYERVTGKIAIDAMRPSYLIFNRGFVQNAPAALAKRLIDIVAAVVGLVLAAPLMVVTAILIRFDSPGPVLFRQERCGRRGDPFTLLKFRSMREDAEKHSGPVWATADDPRITKLGSFLRKSRIDEIPQLFNVLVGTMSMVGPRPERPHFVEDLADKIPYYKQRHIVKPGLTGWAQINYPYGNTIEDATQKLQYDIFYIKNQSLLFDLSILFNTIKTVALRKGT